MSTGVVEGVIQMCANQCWQLHVCGTRQTEKELTRWAGARVEQLLKSVFFPLLKKAYEVTAQKDPADQMKVIEFWFEFKKVKLPHLRAGVAAQQNPNQWQA